MKTGFLNLQVQICIKTKDLQSWQASKQASKQAKQAIKTSWLISQHKLLKGAQVSVHQRPPFEIFQMEIFKGGWEGVHSQTRFGKMQVFFHKLLQCKCFSPLDITHPSNFHLDLWKVKRLFGTCHKTSNLTRTCHKTSNLDRTVSQNI
jgi:hypothetical protein